MDTHLLSHVVNTVLLLTIVVLFVVNNRLIRRHRREFRAIMKDVATSKAMLVNVRNHTSGDGGHREH